MYFQLRKDAEQWFKDIAKSYPTKFDLYYLCLMASFASGGQKNSDISSNEVSDLVENFPGEFKSRGKLLVGLLIHTELRHLGIDLEDRDAVYKQVRRIVEPDSTSYMSNEGVRLMNQYAHGGFDLLCEHFADRPRAIETFIRKYARCISDLKQDKSS
jgi:hypothetical protein